MVIAPVALVSSRRLLEHVPRFTTAVRHSLAAGANEALTLTTPALNLQERFGTETLLPSVNPGKVLGVHKLY